MQPPNILQRFIPATLALLLTLASIATGNASGVGDFLRRGDFDAAVDAAAADPDHPITRLIQASRERRLADADLWQALLHYRSERDTGKSISEIDGEWFFLSDNGKNDPEKELEATIAAFFSRHAKPPMRLTPYCRFVARRHWLFQQLGELQDLIPKQRCTEFERFKRFLKPERLTLIFPSEHPNSPSSAFGHTLLRFDHANQAPETRMLNMSLNFAAEIPADTSAFSYAINGLSGGFPGRFTALPYHLKLREYGQMENRDIWEYPLKLSQADIDLVTRHAYEMLIAEYDYYFAHENCSYHLLSLLDVTTAEDRLTDRFGIWTIPVDTIRLLKQRDLIGKPTFHASTSRRIKARIDKLPAHLETLAYRGIDDGVDAISTELDRLRKEERAAILDLMIDYLRYRRFLRKDELTLTPGEEERKVLMARSQLGVQGSALPVEAPTVSPDLGHGTGRVTLAIDRSDRLEVSWIEFRPAYHDLLDPAPGFSRSASIDFLGVAAGWDDRRRALFLKSLTLLDIESLEPRDRLFKPLSWHTRFGWHRESAADRPRFTALGGAGLAYDTKVAGTIRYLFAEISAIHDADLERENTLLGTLRAGILSQPWAGARLKLEIMAVQDAGNGTQDMGGSIRLGQALARDLAVEAEVSKRASSDVSDDTIVTIRIKQYH